MTDLAQYRNDVNRKLGELRSHRARVQEEAAALARLANTEKLLREAQTLVQQVSQQVQQQAHNAIANVVTQCLDAVFDEPYVFKIKFERKRGRTEAGLLFVREGMEVDPMTASGGGVVDVAAFALRLSCLLLHQPPVARVMVLDEPWKFLSAQHRPRMRLLLQQLSKDMAMQFLIVTHIDDFKMGTIIDLS